MTVQPYLFFDGKCEEALEFYKSAIGAKVDMLMRFKENPDKPDPSKMPPNSADKVMHAAFKVGDTQILASDGHCAGKPSFQGFGLAQPLRLDNLQAKLEGESFDGGWG